MKPRRIIYTCSIASICMAAATCSGNEAADQLKATELLAIEVIGEQALNTQAFNEQLRAAGQAGQNWTLDIVQVASRLLRPEIARDAIWTLSGRGERPGAYSVMIVTDGIPDDSIRGKRYRAVISRAADGTWKFDQAMLSWRCWREPDSVFDVRPCP